MLRKSWAPAACQWQICRLRVGFQGRQRSRIFVSPHTAQTFASKDTFTMFTGITEHVGKIEEFHHGETGGRLRVSLEGSPSIAADMPLGDSISVNGCCLTVVESDPAPCATVSPAKPPGPPPSGKKKTASP